MTDSDDRSRRDDNGAAAPPATNSDNGPPALGSANRGNHVRPQYDASGKQPSADRTCGQGIDALVLRLLSTDKGSIPLDREVAYAIGFGDPVSRRAFEKYGPTMKKRGPFWLPFGYTTDSTRALGLLPEGDEWDRKAEGKSALQICVLALEACAAGHRPRLIPSTTCGRQYLGPKASSVARTAKATAARLARGPLRKLAQHDIGEIKRLKTEGQSLRRIAQKHGVSHQTIHRVLKGTYGIPT